MILQLNSTEPGCEQRVVNGPEVEQYTRGGQWYVVALIQDQITTAPHSSGQFGYHNSMPVVPPPEAFIPRLETRYLLQRNSDAVRLGLINTKEAAETRFHEISKEKRELVSIQKGLENQVGVLETQVAKDQTYIKEVEKKRELACEATRRYEGDLGILRKEIGEARCRELLGK